MAKSTLKFKSRPLSKQTLRKKIIQYVEDRLAEIPCPMCGEKRRKYRRGNTYICPCGKKAVLTFE